jgi:RNA polymerase sigma-70 factor (ECF subfamily)
VWAVSDDALLAGLAAGDPDAAAAFVARFQRRVYGLARSITGDERVAEDVAQEALLRAWRHAGAYDARRGSVVTWLLTITRNLAIDAMRVRRPLVLDPADLAETELEDTAETAPEHAAARADDAARLLAALRTLPVEQRRAVVLAGLHGYSAREIGELEGIPLGTAKTRIRTALIRLRASFVTPDHAGGES